MGMIRVYLTGRELRIPTDAVRGMIGGQLARQDKTVRVALRAFIEYVRHKLDDAVQDAHKTGSYGHDWSRPKVPRGVDTVEYMTNYVLDCLAQVSADYRINIRGTLHEDEGGSWLEITGVDAPSPVVPAVGPAGGAGSSDPAPVAGRDPTTGQSTA